MNLYVRVIAFLLCCIVIAYSGVGAQNPRVPVFPEPLLMKLGIEIKDILDNQEKFRTDPTHAEWMDHVHQTMPDISRDKEEAVITAHTSLLYIKKRMDQSFFSGRMDKQEFTTRLAELMQWFQDANRAVLSEKEYNLLFGITDQNEESAIAQVPDGELGFPIYNPETTVEMIKERLDDRTIADITRFYRHRSQELRDIREVYETKDFGGATQWQVKKDMARIENELKAAFMGHCRDKLTDEEFQLLFGNQQ